jgi:DNA repair protein RecN (Recombination protein N)
MLSNLLIKNYALIQELEMAPDPGLNIITGETGAGKSIMLGAIGLLLGNRADIKSLYDPTMKCIIEGTFNLTGYDLSSNFEEENLDFSSECIVRREISVAGKSRAFINDTPVNLEILKRISNQLLDIHSQHDAILLGTNDFQLQVVDTYAEAYELKNDYNLQYNQYKETVKQLEALKTHAKQLHREFDYDQFLYQELAQAQLIPQEQTTLESELSILENAAEIKEKLSLAHSYFDHPENSLLELLKEAIGVLTQAGRLVPSYDLLKERAQSALIELRDISDEIESTLEDVEIDENRKELVNERLSLIYTLLKKHQVNSTDALLVIQQQLEKKVSSVLNLDEDLLQAEKAVENARKKMLKSGELLTKKRQSVLSNLQSSILERLVELGIPNASLSVELSPIAPSPTGLDSVSFLFSGNKGIKPQELKQVASGGEFSRLMMVIKYILADRRKLPTIIFDEVDTGVSGEIAKKMGKMMQQMSQNHQIIAISHLHQIASSGDAHYFVYKDHSSDRTVSKIKKLNEEERIMEIAHMIGGLNPSESVIHNAKEMISKN